MDGIIALMVWAVVIIFALGYVPFVQAFSEKYNRSFIHWELIITVIVFVVSFGIGYEWSDIIRIVSVAVMGILLLVYIKRYSILWAIGLFLYTLLTIGLVITVIRAITSFFEDEEKRT